jgi:hypothetical protein
MVATVNTFVFMGRNSEAGCLFAWIIKVMHKFDFSLSILLSIADLTENTEGYDMIKQHLLRTFFKT